MPKKISPEVFKDYRGEVRGYLPGVREAINAFHKDQSCLEELAEARRQVHIIKGASGMVGMEPMSTMAGEIEQILEALETRTLQPTDELTEQLGIALDVIGNCTDSSETPGNASFDGFDESLAALKQFGDHAPADASDEGETTRKSDAPKQKKIPQELLDVFMLEAEDHFNSIRTLLEFLQTNPADKSLVQELRRTVHTLKGSAGAVGFDQLAGLSHRMEDVLDALYDTAVPIDEKIFQLLAASADALEDIAADKASQEVVDDIYSRLRAMLPGPATAGANPTADTISAPADSREKPAEPTEAAAGDDMVRVSQDRIDTLIKTVGELEINRSTLRQHLTELDGRMENLAGVIERLHTISGRLETEYELAGMNRRQSASDGTADKDSEFDDLEFDRYTEFHHLLRQLSEAASDIKTFKYDIGGIMNECAAISTAQGRLCGDIQERLMGVRMVPLSSIANRLRQIVRVVAQSQGKMVDLVIEGEQIEIDKKLLEEIVDPLMHVIRNDIDHGIETPEQRLALGKNERGLIRVRAFHEGSKIVIAISDDGAGLQLERIRERAVDKDLVSPEESRSLSDDELCQMIFHTKLSTAEHVSELSGRGIGMDVVKQQVTKLQGSLNLESTPGRGTLLTIRLPMSLSIRRSLLVEACGGRYAIPLSSLKTIIRVTAECIPAADDAQEIEHENETYAYVHLGRFMGSVPKENQSKGSIPLLIVDVGTRFIALQVDAILGEQDIVVKSLGTLVQHVRGVAGATVSGDGKVMLVINPLDIGLAEEPGTLTPVTNPPSKASREQEQLLVMIVDDSISVRQVVSNLVESSGWKALTASDGADALEILQTLERRPDIIILDVEMPRMDGYELLTRLKSRDMWRRIPVIMLTSRAGEKHRLRALELGAAEYIVKPYQDDTMRAAIQHLTNQS